MPRSLAFKLTYSDGCHGDPASSDFVGFRGACSRDLIAHNVNKHVWCQQPKNPCRQFYEKGMKGSYPTFPCMESELFEHWKFNGGMWHNGEKAGQPVNIMDAAVGKIVVLTTRRPDQNEAQRKIIGLYEIGHIDDQRNLIAHKSRRIRLQKSESELLDFWRYYRNENDNTPSWKTLLYRYIDDGRVHRILEEVSTIAGGTSKTIAEALIQRHFKDQPAPPSDGCLTATQEIKKIIAQKRKYPGGEGPDHLLLKEWIAKHPTAVGLPAGAKAKVEHMFDSGDCVDIAFELPDKSWAVVEIETTAPYPGAHQAIKYRSLLAAQRRWNLESNKVAAILVAWGFRENSLKFCRQYSIAPWICRVGDKLGTKAA